MPLSDKDLSFCKRYLTSVPLSAIASKIKIDLLDLSSELRRKGIIEEIQPHEIQFIKDSLDKMPASEIQARLSLTPSQFSQILQHKLGAQRRRPADILTIEEVVKKTKWLIEEKLKMEIDDFLPREISGDDFVKADLYSCIKFANQEKEKDQIFRSFPSIAFLVCKAYPDTFEPFQFKHSKNMDFFLGKSGRKNILNAIAWVLEKKLKINLSDISLISKNKYFLRTRDLSFYGISPNYYRRLFSNKADLVDALVKHVSGNSSRHKSMTTVKRELSESGISLTHCEIPECNYNGHSVDIHHIYPKARISRIEIDPNLPENLISLCPNHHRKANKFDWKGLNPKFINDWKKSLISFICDIDSV